MHVHLYNMHKYNVMLIVVNDIHYAGSELSFDLLWLAGNFPKDITAAMYLIPPPPLSIRATTILPSMVARQHPPLFIHVHTSIYPLPLFLSLSLSDYLYKSSIGLSNMHNSITAIIQCT